MKALLSAIIAVVMSFATAHAATDNHQVIAVDSLGFSVVMPDSTVPTSKYIFWHEGVKEWYDYQTLKTNPEPWKDSTERRVVFYAEYAHPRGAYYTVIVRVFGPLYYTPSEEAELRWEATADIGLSKMRSDTLHYYRPVTVNGNPGRSLAYGGTEDRPNIVHGLTVLHGDTIYTLYAHLSGADDTTEAAEFLSSFRPKPGPVASTISTPKGAAYLRFIRTLPDKELTNHFFYRRLLRDFAKADLPAMYEALRTPFADEGMDEFFSMRRNLLNGIVKMDSTPDIAFLSDLYRTESLEDFRRSILQALVQIGKVESVSAAAQFMLTDPPEYSDYHLLYHKGRPELARYMLPCVPALLEHPHWREAALDFLTSMLANNHITTSDLAPYSNSISRHLSRYLGSYAAWRQTGTVQSSNDLYRPKHGAPIPDVVLASFLCNQPDIIPILQTLVQDSALGLYACASLLRCGERIDSSLVYRLASDPATRALLYGAMQQTGTLAHFPKEFRSQQSITESIIISNYTARSYIIPEIADDEKHGYTPEVEYIATRDYRDTVYNTFSGRFLYFKVLLPPSAVYLRDYDEDGEITDDDTDESEEESEEMASEEQDDTPRWYIMLYGPYSLDPSEIDADGEMSGHDIVLPFDGNADEELFARMFRYFLLSHQPG